MKPTALSTPATETPPPDGPAQRATRIAFRWMRAATETRGLVVLAITVRLLAAWNSPAILDDSVSLMRSAERVLAGGPGAILAIPHHPLPTLLFALGAASGMTQTIATLLVAVASGIAVVPLHSLARRACGRHAATAACILYVALPKAVAVGAVPIEEGVFLPLFLGSLALAAGARDAGARITRRLLGAGLLAGLAYLCRPEGLVAFPAALAAAALDGRPGRLRRAGLVLAGFVLVAAPYVTLLSAHRGAFALSPKKDVMRFVGVAEPRVGVPAETVPVPPPRAVSGRSQAPGTTGVLQGIGGAFDSALTLPLCALALIGLLRRRRWRRKRSRRARLLLAGSALLLTALLMRLQAGWGYSGGRHALAAATILLPFAGEGLMGLAGVLPRVTSRRRFAFCAAVVLALPLGTKAVLRPPGENRAAARCLGEALAARSAAGEHLRIASSAASVVAYYADQALRERGGAAIDIPLFGRFVTPIERGAAVERVAGALAHELRPGADWIVLDVAPPAEGESASATLRLARALRGLGVLDEPAVAAGSELAAFPVRRAR